MTDSRLDRSDLERLFARGVISRRQFTAAIAALGVTAGGLEMLFGSPAQPAEAKIALPEYLVLIVLDGFRPDYTDLEPMPALRALARAGVSYDRAWVGQMESQTPTGHASIGTGSLPIHHGVIGFEWRDPQTKQEVLDGWTKGVISGLLDQDLRAGGTGSLALAIKAADPTATIVSVSSAKVDAADAMGGWAADYILYHRRTGPQTNTLAPAGLNGHVPPADFLAQPGLQQKLPLTHFTDWDYLSTVLALAAARAFQPRALLVNLPGADVYGHAFGGPATPAVMKQVLAGLDRNIGRILSAYKAAGIYDQTLFVVTADHGMVPNDRFVDGAMTRAAVTRAGTQYFFHTGGSCADIYLRDYWHARAVAREMARVPNVASSYYQVSSQGQYHYQPAPDVNIGHDLDAAYQYLLGTFAGPTAPDVVTPFRENTIGTSSKTAHGDHGGLSWGAQHVPLIMTGPGVRSGATSHFPARLTDIAPTVLRVLGLPTNGMDGVVLADGLLSASAEDSARQSGLATTLTRYQDALIEQAKANIAEDIKVKALPPPSAPPRP